MSKSINIMKKDYKVSSNRSNDKEISNMNLMAYIHEDHKMHQRSLPSYDELQNALEKFYDEENKWQLKVQDPKEE